MRGRKFVSQEHALATEGRDIQERRWYQKASTVFSITFFTFSFVVSVSLIAFTIMFFFSRVEGSSMMSELNTNYVYIDENGNRRTGNNTDSAVVNRHLNPHRGNIIIVSDPRPGQSGMFIKRLIALGGDHLYFRRERIVGENGTPYDDLGRPVTVGNGLIHRFVIELDGVDIDESYLDPYWGMNVVYGYVWDQLRPVHQQRPEHMRGILGRHGVFVQERGRYEILVPHDHMFYMGDNRGGSGIPTSEALRSLDSTRLGPQPMSDFLGVVVDIVPDNITLPGWIWGRFVWFITFRWV